MTESSHPADAHPSDEQLSAAIDGADKGAADHASSCSRCTYRMEAMRGVALAIGTPPAVDDVLRERVVRAALEHDVDAVGAGGGGARSKPAWTWIAGVAAALLLAVLVVPALLSEGDGDDATTTAADRGRAQFEAAGGTGSQNLGTFKDEQELAGVIGPLIGDTDTFTAEQTDAGAGSDDAAPAPTTASPPGAVGREGAQFASGAPCAGAVAQEYGQGLGLLAYSAYLTWKDTPAVLLAYSIADAQGPLDHRVFVMASEGCTLLTVLSL